MSLEAKITVAAGWRRFEAKQLRVTCVNKAGGALDLSALELRAIFCRQQDDPPLLVKTSAAGITFEGAGHDVAVVTVTPPADYALLPAGDYYWEGWDDTNHEQLWWGDAHLGPGQEAAP